MCIRTEELTDFVLPQSPCPHYLKQVAKQRMKEKKRKKERERERI